MSKPIAVHADGSNCYTKNCKLRAVSNDFAGSLAAKLDVLDEKPVGSLVVKLRASLVGVYVEPSTAGFVNVDGIQERINSLAGTVAGGQALRAELLRAEFELEEFKKAHYRDYSDEAGRLGRVARLRVGAWKRALYLHDDKVEKDVTYKLYYSSESAEDVKFATDIEQAIKRDSSAHSMDWGSGDLRIEGVRESVKSERELVFLSKNEELCLNLGDYQVGSRWETDLAELLPL